MEGFSIRPPLVQRKDRQGTSLPVDNFESSESVALMSRDMECRNVRDCFTTKPYSAPERTSVIDKGILGESLAPLVPS